MERERTEREEGQRGRILKHSSELSLRGENESNLIHRKVAEDVIGGDIQRVGGIYYRGIFL